jgi:hypothetical protein
MVRIVAVVLPVRRRFFLVLVEENCRLLLLLLLRAVEVFVVGGSINDVPAATSYIVASRTIRK